MGDIAIVRFCLTWLNNMADNNFDLGVIVFPEGGSNYGHAVKWEPPSTYFPAGAISIVEIVKAPQSQSGVKPKMAKFNEAQKARGTYSRRIYIWRDQIHGILEALNRVMDESMGETGPDVESPYQYEKKGKANRELDADVEKFSEFGSAPVLDADDSNAPF